MPRAFDILLPSDATMLFYAAMFLPLLATPLFFSAYSDDAPRRAMRLMPSDIAIFYALRRTAMAAEERSQPRRRRCASAG